MSLVVNTNIGSLNAQRSLASSSNELATAMERLSSGKKINSAADDAAGFAIAERMTAQVRGLNMAVKNASDAISLLDTTQGMYDDQLDIVQRIRELAIQAANDTNSTEDRQFLQDEVNALVAEAHRISEDTTFNDESVGGWKSFQVGVDANQSIETYIGTHGYHTGAAAAQLTQAVSAGATTLELKSLSTGHAFAADDIIFAGLENTNEGEFLRIESVQEASFNDDGTFTQTITLFADEGGVVSDLDANFHLVMAISTYDSDAGTWSNGGRGSLQSIDLVNDAAGALVGIDSAIRTIVGSGASVGALQNRLEYTVSNLMNVSEFTTAARSRIEDADFAAESARLAKAQVLQQTGTAMLAQANSSSQLVLSLIR
jgi:flagellin